MANPKHLEILMAGREAWNDWRKADSNIFPDLSGFDFRTKPFDGFDLSRTNLVGANLHHVGLDYANLAHSYLGQANLYCASLVRASLAYADLRDANFSFTTLVETDLSNAVLWSTNFSNALFNKTDLTEATLTQTILTSVDLRGVRGMERVKHAGPCSIGIDTLYKSHGEISENFLRNTGVPEETIDLARSIRCGPAIQWNSSVISYSTKDEGFARRLHSRMREANMRVWFAPEHLHGGKKLHEQLFEAIQLHDRLLLVLSENSIKSEWVMTETRKAREVEKRENRRKLFPVRLVDFDTLRNWTCFDADSGKDLAVEVREYFIPDFSNWKDHDAFEKAFTRLQQDLKAEKI